MLCAEGLTQWFSITCHARLYVSHFALFGTNVHLPHCDHLVRRHIRVIYEKLTLFVLFFSAQPPPMISDKQLDEREHTVEEWKGSKDSLSTL